VPQDAERKALSSIGAVAAAAAAAVAEANCRQTAAGTAWQRAAAAAVALDRRLSQSVQRASQRVASSLQSGR